jgi:hypothetical protein
MRNSRVVKAGLPLLAGAALFGSTMAATASAAIPHTCGATTTFANKLDSFEKVYDQGAKSLGQPAGSTTTAIAAYLGKATAFFKTSASGWAAVGKYAPSSVKSSFNASIVQLQKTASDFSAAQTAVKADKVSAMNADIKTAQKDADDFDTVLQPLIKKCS